MSFDTLVAIVPIGEILTSNTFASTSVTVLRMTIALALLTIREVPKTWLALVTLTTVCVRMAATLTGNQVTFVVRGANTVAVTSCREINVN